MSYLKAAVTLMDVARSAGVSKMTVSNVVNGKPGMSQQTRERVLDAIERTGFVANPAARVLAGQSMNLLGMVLPSFGSPYLNEIVRGATTAAATTDFDLAIFTTSYQPKRERERAMLLRAMADGVLLVMPLSDEHQIFMNRVPVVTVNAEGPYTVRTDNIQGGRLAAQHLLELGHRRIALVDFPKFAVNVEDGKVYVPRQDVLERKQSFLATLQLSGVVVPQAFQLEVEANPDNLTIHVPRMVRQLLELENPPTAIFAMSDEIAVAVLQAAADLGVCVPDALSVVGFDDAPQACKSHPTLTTIRQHLFEIGQTAFVLLSELARGLVPLNPHPVLSTELVVRQSTTQAPRHDAFTPEQGVSAASVHTGGED